MNLFFFFFFFFTDLSFGNLCPFLCDSYLSLCFNFSPNAGGPLWQETSLQALVNAADIFLFRSNYQRNCSQIQVSCTIKLFLFKERTPAVLLGSTSIQSQSCFLVAQLSFCSSQKMTQLESNISQSKCVKSTIISYSIESLLFKKITVKALYLTFLYYCYYYLTNTFTETAVSPLFFSFFLRHSWMRLQAPGVYTLEPICSKTDRENGLDKLWFL